MRNRIVNPQYRDRAPAEGGLYPAPNHLSFSQITTLSPRYHRSCPRKWAYDKLLGLPRGAGNGMTLGKALDEAATNFFTRRQLGDNATTAHAAALEDVANVINHADTWTEQKRPRADYVSMMNTAFGAFAAHFAELIPAALQRDHTYRVTGHDGSQRTVIGYSDWIEQDGTIVDLKYTGSPMWNADGDWYPDRVTMARDQICTYYMGRLYAQQQGAPDTFAPIVPRGKMVVVCTAINRKSPVIRELEFTFDNALVLELLDAIRDADATARSDFHAPRPGPACEWCSYVDRCQSDCGRAALTDRQLAAPPANPNPIVL